MTPAQPLTPFPILIDEPPEAWRWPACPLDWRHVAPPAPSGGEPCTLLTSTGSIVQGYFAGLDPDARSIAFRTPAGTAPIDVPFARFQRLTLAAPLRSVDVPGKGVAKRVPAAAHLRDIRVFAPEGVLTIRSCGHVENGVGLFLFTPGHDEYSLVREVIPRGAYHRIEIGPSSRDAALEKWIGTPEELRAAVERQRHMSIQPIGQSLLELGMVTPEQLQRALAQPAGDLPLGERMVKAGVISKADLQTAIAHKMGYPMVDLTRFPIDPAAARKLPLRMAVAHRALPIMVEDDRLLIAMDRPSRVNQLTNLYALAAFSVVPVLSTKGQILLALSALSDQDLWKENVSIQAGFFNTVL